MKNYLKHYLYCCIYWKLEMSILNPFQHTVRMGRCCSYSWEYVRYVLAKYSVSYFCTGNFSLPFVFRMSMIICGVVTLFVQICTADPKIIFREISKGQQTFIAVIGSQISITWIISILAGWKVVKAQILDLREREMCKYWQSWHEFYINHLI